MISLRLDLHSHTWILVRTNEKVGVMYQTTWRSVGGMVGYANRGDHQIRNGVSAGEQVFHTSRHVCKLWKERRQEKKFSIRVSLWKAPTRYSGRETTRHVSFPEFNQRRSFTTMRRSNWGIEYSSLESLPEENLSKIVWLTVAAPGYEKTPLLLDDKNQETRPIRWCPMALHAQIV